VNRGRTTLFLALNALGVLLPAFGDEMSARPVEVVQTERVSFAPGGVIHVPHSFGSVTVEGWDRPEVEVTVVKSRERYYEPEQLAGRVMADEHIVVAAVRNRQQRPPRR
jgi:hypothetical protein